MTRSEAITVLKAFMDNPLFSDVHKAAFNIAIHDTEKYQQWNLNELVLHPKEVPTGKWISTKQLDEMYSSYEKSLWREHEDVRGDDMVEMGTALNLLSEELCLLGCWDDDEVEEQQGEDT